MSTSLLTTLLLVAVQSASTATKPTTSPERIAVVSFGRSPEIQRVAAESTARQRALGPQILTNAAIRELLAGTDTGRQADPESLRLLLKKARELEARFAVDAANALRRRVVDAFDRDPRPSGEILTLAANAAFDSAAAFFVDGRQKEAERHAQEASRRFPNWQSDPRIHSPSVRRFFAAQRRAFNHKTSGKLTVRVIAEAEAEVFADGRILGTLPPNTAKFFNLPLGDYRLWARIGSTVSFPLPVKIGDDPANATINLRLGRCLSLRPHIRHRCNDIPFTDTLEELRRALGADKLIAITAAPGGVAFAVEVFTVFSGPRSPTRELKGPSVLAIDPALPQTPHWAWNAVPFGGGQLSQGRIGAGLTWAFTQGAMLAWHLFAAQRRARLVSGSDQALLDSAIKQQNISAGLFYTTLAGGIIEAFVNRPAIKAQPPARLRR